MNIEALHTPFLRIPPIPNSPTHLRKSQFPYSSFQKTTLRGRTIRKITNYTSPTTPRIHYGFQWLRCCPSQDWRLNFKNRRFAGGKDSIPAPEKWWADGLVFVRYSVFVAIVSAVGFLIWLGKKQTRRYVETRLLPSVSSVLSEALQRELDLGKVHRISPWSITLQSCFIGPSKDEFSCGDLPFVKLCLRPFASLRRGRIIFDAVLAQPTLLVSQKEDYSWLGIPAPAEKSYKQRTSDEEGIDRRTRIRRAAREEVAAKWEQQRNEDARKAAKEGYVVTSLQSESVISEEAYFRENDAEASTSGQFFCSDERMPWRDHHCIDTGVGYDMKHASLEKSFGAGRLTSRAWFWPRLGFNRRFKKKKKGKRKEALKDYVMVQKKLLEKSAAAAVKYFERIDRGSSEYGVGQELLDRLAAESSHREKLNNDDHVLMNGEGISEKVSYSETETVDSMEKNRIGRKLSTAEGSKFVQAHAANSQLDDVHVKDHRSSKHGPNGLTSNDVHKETAVSENVTRSSSSLAMGESEAIGSGIHRENANDEDRRDLASRVELKSDYVMQVDLVQGPKIAFSKLRSSIELNPLFQLPTVKNPRLTSWTRKFLTSMDDMLNSYVKKVRQFLSSKAENFAVEFVEVMEEEASFAAIDKMLPVTLDSVYCNGGTLMLLGYGDQEPREMQNTTAHVQLQNHYGRVHVVVSGYCKDWRTGLPSKGGGWLSADVFVDIVEQKWHANLKIVDLFAPLFERILELPFVWSKGRASGEVHICMSNGDTFPNLHGQLDVDDIEFEIYDAPASFSGINASLCFRGQKIFIHNASGWFGDAPIEASGDFGINPEDGEYHMMCQVPCVEVNALMRTFKMKPLLFPLAGSVTAVLNCQGPLDTPVIIGSGIISRRGSQSFLRFPLSLASEAVLKNKEAGAVAAFDRIPFSYVSANFTYYMDNNVADLYGIRATLLDGGEIRGAGNAWICPEGEFDDSALDVNWSGSIAFDNVLYRYLPADIETWPVKVGYLKGETKLSGSLLRPRFDVKWVAPDVEESFGHAHGDIIISHDYVTVNSSSAAFELYLKATTSYPEDSNSGVKGAYHLSKPVPPIIEGVELDVRLRGFDVFNLLSSDTFDAPKPLHLKATGRIKFQGLVQRASSGGSGEQIPTLVGDILLSGIKINQLMLAPHLVGSVNFNQHNIKLDASGRPDENLMVEISCPLWHSKEDDSQGRKMVSASLQKGQLRANIYYEPCCSANLEVRNLPLDELELASLRGAVQKVELQLNLQKRRGHGSLSVVRPKFSGVLGEALDVSGRWSGDVITIEKSVLEQSHSKYELQGEYVLPGMRDRYSMEKGTDGLFKQAMAGQFTSMISSMGRWRMRLEVPGAQAAEMLPLARLLSRSSDPAVRSRSKELFMQGLQAAKFCPESLRELLEELRRHDLSPDEVNLEEIPLPRLSELKGWWRGSLDASGGGNGDTMADFDLHGEDWEWGSHKTQRVIAVGAYSNNDGLRLEKIFIQRDNATLHADGTLLGPRNNLHFAVLNFPVTLISTLLQLIENSATEAVQSTRALLTSIKGTLHMEGDLRGSLAKPQCDIQIRLLDGVVGGIDLGKAEIVASLTSSSRFLFNANIEPVIQSGHVHIQGSVPVSPYQSDMSVENDAEREINRKNWIPSWMQEKIKAGAEIMTPKRVHWEKSEEGRDLSLVESLKGLNWNISDAGEVSVDVDVKDGGMMLLTALSPYTNWLHGNAEIIMQVRGTVEQPLVDGTASFHRASVSSPVFPMPLTNFGGTLNVKANHLCIHNLESRVGRKGKLIIKGKLPLDASIPFPGDKIDLKCEVLEVRAKNVFSGQVDSQIQLMGSILQPHVSGLVKLSRGEAYLPHDKGAGNTVNRLTASHSSPSRSVDSYWASSKNVGQFSASASAHAKHQKSAAKSDDVDMKKEQTTNGPRSSVHLNNLSLHLGPELKIVYPLILNFAVTGELELNGLADSKWIRPKGTLTFENGDVNLVATQVRLKRDHPNVAKFEPDQGLDPMLDLALVGSEYQLKVQGPASRWQDNLVITSTRTGEQDALSPLEAAKVFENQLAESLLEGDGQLALKKLAAATLETLMPRIEGKGEFGHARWRLVYAPQIPSLLSLEPTVDPLKSLATSISFGTEVEVQLGKRLQASVVRQMKESEMATQWTLIYQLTSRLRILFQSAPSSRLLFEYSATSQD